jgi:phage-related baseplate assembly protein
MSTLLPLNALPLAAVDISQLPSPDAVEPLDFETIYADLLAYYRTSYPQFTAALESDPVVKLTQAFAYRELLLRQRVNEALRAAMIASSRGADLENLAAFFGVTRLSVLNDETDELEPESDDRLRRRAALAVETYSSAGAPGAYKYHALTAAPTLKDVSAISPAPGEVLVTLLGGTGDGSVTDDELNAVRAVLDREEVRPLTDVVAVSAPEIIEFEIDAGLVLYPGPDAETVRRRAQEAVTAYAFARHRLGQDVTLSGLHAALHQNGVQRVTIREPAPLPLIVEPTQAAYCIKITVTVDGRDE